jgi:HEAT repeat protein/type 1 glutamine amidotransferase
MGVAMLNGAASAAALNALIVDGQNNHKDWKKTTAAIKEILEGTGLFEVEVATTPGQGKPMDGFAPQWSKYNVIVSNYNGAEWPEATRKAFVEYMSGGGGLVVVHAADNAFAKWPEYNEMIGMGGWGGRNEKSGPYVYMKDGKWVRDESPGPGGHHGKQTPYVVTTRESEHPIMKGLPAAWMHCADELYCKLRGPAKNMTILASAISDAKTGGTGREEAILMALTYGKGRIFHDVMGHSEAQHKCVGFIVTLQRGTQWAATGKVTQTAVPADFPTADKPSLREKDLGKAPDAGAKADVGPTGATAAPIYYAAMAAYVAGAKADEGPTGATAAPIDYAAMASYVAGETRAAFTNCEEQMRGAPAEKLAQIEAGLLKVLQDPKATFDAKQYVCRLLRRCGSDACVPALARLLSDEKLAHMARFALTYMAGEKAGEALRENLSTAPAGLLASAIDSVARRGDRKAVGAIAKIAAGSDDALASAALAALGRIGGPEAAKVLAGLKPAKANQRVWADAYLKAADSLAAEGRTADAEAIYTKMYSSGQETMSRVAALRGLARTAGQKAVPILLAALKDENLDIQAAAGKFITTVSGQAAGKALADSLGSLTPRAQMLVISTLAGIGDKSLAGKIVKYVSAGDEPVRLAAIRALGVLGDAGCVGVIAGQLAAGGETTNAARASLASMTAPGAGAAMVKLLSSSLPSPSKADVIEVLISRREAGAMEVFMSAAAGSDADVARAAAKAVGVLGGAAELPKLIAMFLAQKDDARRDQLAQAIGSIAARGPNADAPAGMIIDAIAKADLSSRPQLVALLARAAGAKALAEARRQLKSPDAETRKAAINALAAWPTIEPADDLLAVAKADNGTEAILAIRGCTSLLGKRGNAKPADAVAKLAEAMGVAKRIEEKRAILAVLPNVACDEAVKLAESLTGDQALAREANLAVEKTKAAMTKPTKGKGRGKKAK